MSATFEQWARAVSMTDDVDDPPDLPVLKQVWKIFGTPNPDPIEARRLALIWRLGAATYKAGVITDDDYADRFDANLAEAMKDG